MLISKCTEVIGSLLYLTASRPDIHFSICLCARFQTNPKELYLKAVKRIMKYLIGTQDLVFGILKIHHLILLNIVMLILHEVELIEKVHQAHANFLGML